jgi:hypothetical protein
MLLVQIGINSTRDVWKCAKLDSPRRLVQFWQNFQTSLVLLIPNCTRHRLPILIQRLCPLLGRTVKKCNWYVTVHPISITNSILIGILRNFSAIQPVPDLVTFCVQTYEEKSSLEIRTSIELCIYGTAWSCLIVMSNCPLLFLSLKLNYMSTTKINWTRYLI